MSLMECWLLGGRVKVSARAGDGAQVVLGWRPAQGFAPVLLAKKRFPVEESAGVAVRPAKPEDMAAIRGLYALTGGRGALLPVRDGLWTAEAAWVAEDGEGRVCAYCVGSAMNGVWNIYEWGMLPDADAAKCASALAAVQGCDRWQMRAEFAPEGGEAVSGECVYLGVPEPFLLGTRRIESASQLAALIDEAQGGR